MNRTQCIFTQEAMTRLLKAAAAAGVSLRIEIERGKVVVLTGEPKSTEPPAKPAHQIVL
jgi:hypothetical protein